MRSTLIFFYLLNYARQYFEAACCTDQLSDEEEQAAFKKYEAALLLIADQWTENDVNRAKKLVDDLGTALGYTFVLFDNDYNDDDPDLPPF